VTTIDDCRIIDLRKIARREGSITPVEENRDVPFSIARVYYLYDVPGGASRGGHAHRELQQLFVSVMGSFAVLLDDGTNRKTVNLNRAYYGLYVPKLIWRELYDFSSGGVCLVLASQTFSEADYFREYGEFKAFRQSQRSLIRSAD
jgi:WxcM-like protein